MQDIINLLEERSYNGGERYIYVNMNIKFKNLWGKLTPDQKKEFLNYYNKHRYNPSRNSIGPRSNSTQINLTVDQFEATLNDAVKLLNISDDVLKNGEYLFKINKFSSSKTPLHDMVENLICDNNKSIKFEYEDLERYFNFKVKREERTPKEKFDLANQQNSDGKIPLEMIFATTDTWFTSSKCLMKQGKIKTANKIIELLGPYVTNRTGRLLQINDKLFKYGDVRLIDHLPDPVITPVVPTGGYRKRKTHRKTHRKTRKSHFRNMKRY